MGVPDFYRPSGYAAPGPTDNRTDLPTIPHAEKAMILPSIQFSCIQLQSLQNKFVTLHSQRGRNPVCRWRYDVSLVHTNPLSFQQGITEKGYEHNAHTVFCFNKIWREQIVRTYISVGSLAGPVWTIGIFQSRSRFFCAQ